MNPAAKNKLLTWLVLILVLANAATLVSFWISRKKEKEHIPVRGTAADFLIRELKLDENQQAKYREFIEEHRHQVEPIREEIRLAKDSLFSLLGQHADDVDSTRRSILSVSIPQKLSKLEQVTFDHFQKLRAICTSEQQKKFDSIIRQAMQMMAMPGAPGPPGRDRPMPPPPTNTQ